MNPLVATDPIDFLVAEDPGHPSPIPGHIDLWKLALVASRTDNAVIITNALGRVEWVNEGFTRLTEYTLEEMVGRKPGSILQGPDTDPEAVALMRSRVRMGQGFRVEILNYSKLGRPYWLLIDCKPVHDLHGVLTHFLAIESDMTDRKALETRLIDQLRVAQKLNIELEERRKELVRLNAVMVEGEDNDDLTGLKKRTYFQGWLDATLARKVEGETELSMILLDVDDFHEYNGTFGYPAGDEVLQAIGKILELQTRPGDVVARVGGEEFAMLMPGAGEEVARAKGVRIRQTVENHDWNHRPITVSIGVSTIQHADRSRSVEELADHALNQSKWAGRNRVTHVRDLDPSRPSRRFRI